MKGIKCNTTSVELKDLNAALLWIIDNQKKRRSVSNIDRIALAVKKQEILGAIAKANQSAGGGDKKSAAAKSSSAKLRKAITPIDTGKEAAKSAGVGQHTFDAGKLILEAAAKGEVKPGKVLGSGKSLIR